MATPGPAHAYIDPGTGSYIFQLIAASLLGAIYAIKLYWQRLKMFFISRFSKNSDNS